MNQKNTTTNNNTNEQELEIEEISLNELQEEEAIKTIDEIIYNDFEEKLKNQEDDFQEEENLMEVDLANVTLEQVVQDYQGGCDEAFDYIFNHYKPKLERLSRRKNDPDLFLELSEVLWRAVKTFNIMGGAKFNTYYWRCARNHMGTLSIRKNAKKRTAEFGTVSMQQSMNTKDSEVEVGTFIEDKRSEQPFEQTLFRVFLEQNIFPNLKKNEVTAIKMMLEGYTLEDIGQALGGITAPAVHVKLRRLAEKKNVGKQLKELYEQIYCS